MRRLSLLLLLGAGTALQAQNASPYVPLQHWAMPYIEHLITTGVLRDPSPSTRPFKQADLVRALEAVDTITITEAAYATVQRLLAEFRPQREGPQYRLDFDAGLAAATYNVRDPLELGRGVPPRPYGPNRMFVNGGAALDILFGPGIAVTHPYEDTRLRSDPDWFDNRKNGLRVAEAYLGGQWRYADVFYGILDQNWGPSPVQGLLLSDNPYSFDRLYLSVGPQTVKLQAIVGQLDTRTDSTGAPVNRYMLQHRLYVHPRGRWTLALWEGSVWSGVGRQAEAWYLNIMNLGLHVAGYNADAKSFEGMDIERRGAVTLFGQALVGDIHIKRGSTAELKPASYGFTLGAKGGIPHQPVGWTAFYTQVSNIVYRDEDPLTVPLYHLLGTGRNFTDYDQATAKLSILTMSGALLQPEFTVLRQGQGDPRLPLPPVASYPTTPVIFEGVVERTIRLALGGSLERHRFGVVGNAGVHLVHNADHVTGATATHFVGSIRLSFRLRSGGAIR
jgi:capsule assembly protein Wzi